MPAAAAAAAKTIRAVRVVRQQNDNGSSSASRREPLLLLLDDGAAEQQQQSQPSQSQKQCGCSSTIITIIAGAVRRFVLQAVWPGLGLLGESYMLFSLGLLQPVWELLFPDCYNDYDGDEQSDVECTVGNPALVTVAGLIAGMCGMGYCAKFLGRRRGSITTAALMGAGGLGMLAVALFTTTTTENDDDDGNYNSSTVQQQQQQRLLLRLLTASLFVLGLGVGGEYPLAAASASEKSMAAEQAQQQNQAQQAQQEKDDDKELNKQQKEMDGIIKDNDNNNNDLNYTPRPPKEHKSNKNNNNTSNKRGRQVQLVFSMQGAGIFLNSLLLTALLWITGQRTDDYDLKTLLTVWQVTYAVGAVLLLMVFITRVTHLQESAVWQNDRRQQQQQQQLLLQQLQTQQNDKDVGELDDNNNGNDDARSSVAAGATPQDRTTLDADYQQHQLASPISMVSSVSSLSAPSVVVAVRETESADDRPLRDVPEHHHDDDLLEGGDNGRHSAVGAGKHGCCAKLGTRACGASTSARLLLLRRHYGMRLLGCALCWFLWDVAFYGNKLFQSTFLLALTGKETTTLLQFAAAATLNAGVALAGYVAAAFVLDIKAVGRRQLQQWGFFLTGALFVGVGFWLEQLSTAALVAMYLGSSFFGQLGPNATTFLIPAEVFPTELRTVGHGLAAASGKAGALAASLLFHHYGNSSGDSDNDNENDNARLDMFLLSGYASFLACCVTYWTIPETAGLDLHENDIKWRLIMRGRVQEYDGAANHPAHLSVYERYALRRRRQEHAEGVQLLSSDLHELHC